MAGTTRSEDFFSTEDGIKIYYQTLVPPKPKALVLIVHGLAEHSGRYEDVAQFLAKQGYAVGRYDQRGHGKSEGPRAFAQSIEQLADDLHSLVHEYSEQYPKLKIFLLAHSFGGQVSVNYLAQNGKGVAGAVLSAPNLRVAVPISALKRWAGRLLQCVVPKLSLPVELSPEWISHDPKIVKAYREDKMVQKSITVRLGTALLDNVEKIQTLAEKIKVPMLILHGGGDLICSPEGSREFYQNLKAKDRHFKIYPGFYHEILNEIEKAKVYEDVATWLDKRS